MIHNNDNNNHNNNNHNNNNGALTPTGWVYLPVYRQDTEFLKLSPTDLYQNEWWHCVKIHLQIHHSTEPFNPKAVWVNLGTGATHALSQDSKMSQDVFAFTTRPKKNNGGQNQRITPAVVPQKSTKMLSAAVHRPQRLPAPGQCPPWQSVASCRPSAGDRKEGPDDASGGLSPPPAQGLLHVLNVCVCTIIHILSILQYNKTITDNNHKNEIQHYVIQYNVMYNVMHNIIQCNII